MLKFLIAHLLNLNFLSFWLLPAYVNDNIEEYLTVLMAVKLSRLGLYTPLSQFLWDHLRLWLLIRNYWDTYCIAFVRPRLSFTIVYQNRGKRQAYFSVLILGLCRKWNMIWLSNFMYLYDHKNQSTFYYMKISCCSLYSFIVPILFFVVVGNLVCKI